MWRVSIFIAGEGESDVGSAQNDDDLYKRDWYAIVTRSNGPACGQEIGTPHLMRVNLIIDWMR